MVYAINIETEPAMIDPTDIEKKNLEAHVELCAERYRFLESKLNTVEDKVTALGPVMQETHELVHQLSEKHNSIMQNWTIGIIVFLLGLCGWFATQYFETL
jgi:hypothetical protein